MQNDFICSCCGKPKKKLAKTFEGHRYGLQALKPAVEPIIVFQKPYDGKPLSNIVSTGAGALNIEGGRIPTQDEYVINQFEDGMKPFGNGVGHKYKTLRRNAKGYDGLADSDTFKIRERRAEDFPEPSGRWPANLILTEESAERMNGNGKFFYQVSSQLDESDPVYYCGKVSPKERNAGLEEKNNHPTLKPIDLAKYLATLLLPPNGYAPRRIFIPFSGSGSEMIGAGLAGWEHVVGVEFDKENGYVDIAEKRLEHWLK